MSNVAEEMAGAVAALERVCAELRPKLDAEAAWRALQQLEDRERQGDTVSAIDRSELRERLSRDLDRRISGWRLLAGAEAALSVLHLHGLRDGSTVHTLGPGVAVAAAGAAGSDDDVDAILRRIRSIAGEPAPKLQPLVTAAAHPPFADWDEPVPVSETPPPPARPVPDRVEPARPSADVTALPVARVDRLEAELDVLLERGSQTTRRTSLEVAAPARHGPAIPSADPPPSWSGSRDGVAEEAEVEIVVSDVPMPSQARPAPPRGALVLSSREQTDRASALAEIIDEASVEIIQLDPPEPPRPR